MTDGWVHRFLCAELSQPRSILADTFCELYRISRVTLHELSTVDMTNPLEERMSESFKQKTNIVFGDLKVHRVLGVGGFGRVSLVTHKPTGEPYALKALFKGLVIAKRQVCLLRCAIYLLWPSRTLICLSTTSGWVVALATAVTPWHVMRRSGTS